MPNREMSNRSWAALAAGDLGISCLAGVLLALSLAPFGQFYLAWVGLVPLLWRIQSIRTTRRSALLGLVAGLVYFAIGFHWLFFATRGGYIVACVIMSIYWMLACVLFQRIRQFAPIPHTLAVAVIWAACDYLRSTIMGGFPWLQTGHALTPILSLCQIADLTGVYGITAWIALVNATLYRLYSDRKVAVPATGVTVAITATLLIYGFARIDNPSQSPAQVKIALIQSNHVHTPDGEKTVTQEQQIDYLLDHSRAIDDVAIFAWPETTMPPLNVEARTEPGLGGAALFKRTLDQLSSLARDRNAGIVTGGYFVGGFQGELGKRRATDIRNSVYFVSSGGELADRYDKIRLVPFAEYIPFQESGNWMHRVLTNFATASYAAGYRLTPAETPTVFRAGSVRFVTPICFEDTVVPLVQSFFKPDATSNGKRADLILNISNDGWFNEVEKRQHLQIAIFRSIENRVPTARVSNTGQSAFIDSSGRITSIAQPFSESVLIDSCKLDPRLTFYTRFGDVFAWLCIVISVGATGLTFRSMKPISPITE